MFTVRKQYKGFTLLELLLVLALVSILILGALSLYQIQLRNFKVDKTSLQMQQWLQAGMSFYVDCGQWPTDSTQDPNIIMAMMGQSELTPEECPPYPHKIRQYMPLGSDKNGPFPNQYHFGPFDPDGKLFQVTTTIGDDAPLLETIGKMIASRLPNATSTVDDAQDPKTVTVQTMVNAPAQAMGHNMGVIILGMEMVKSTTLSHIKYPSESDCPAGMKAVVLNAIANVQGTRDQSFMHNKHGVYETSTTFNVDDASKLITPTLRVDSTDNNSDEQQITGANEILLISACIPQSQGVTQ